MTARPPVLDAFPSVSGWAMRATLAAMTAKQRNAAFFLLNRIPPIRQLLVFSVCSPLSLLAAIAFMRYSC
ncbi:hypothetical protein B23_1883 [Geobacillus thermoleovorans B23]|nr:hypothetical protein B23_1883 [Geobacillus thermoleovorans B23]